MATRFEIVLPGRDRVGLRAAAEEALDEIVRLEERLSYFRNTSEICRINHLASREPVQVSVEVFQVIQDALAVSKASSGAFDITVAPLMECWGFTRGTGSEPAQDQLNSARACIGYEWVQLNAETRTVRFLKPRMKIDLGAIGKGYAIDVAAQLLGGLGIENALIHGGTSTVFGLGTQADGSPWQIAIEYPTEGVGDPELLSVVSLRNESLSVSAISGKSFRSGDRVLGHVLDPRSGQPVEGAMLSAVVLPSAKESDALSTALLVSGSAGWTELAKYRSRARGLVVERAEGGATRVTRFHLPQNR